MTRIKNVNVFQKNSVLHATFHCLNEKGEKTTAAIFQEIAPLPLLSRYKAKDGWFHLHVNLDIKLTKDNNETFIEVREKNNIAGLYGKANSILLLPAIFLNKGIIDLEEMERFHNALYDFTLVKERNNSRAGLRRATL
jgi:hypothetical protein